MELRQLRYFVAVANENHFGRAAKKLHLSQPPLSKQIKKLEEELEVDLFARSTRRVVLTDAGRVFLDEAREIIEASTEAKQKAKSAQEGLRGRLEVGFISSATLSLLPPVLQLFRERFPSVELNLSELTSAEQMEALYEGRTQIGLVRLPLRAPGLRLEPILEEQLIVALPSKHSLAALERVPLEAMTGLPLIFFTCRLVPGFHAQIVELFERAGARPEIVQHAAHVETVVGLVACGMGLSILPNSSKQLQCRGIVYRPLDAPDATSWLALAWLKETDSVLVENFYRTVCEVAKDTQLYDH